MTELTLKLSPEQANDCIEAMLAARQSKTSEIQAIIDIAESKQYHIGILELTYLTKLVNAEWLKRWEAAKRWEAGLHYRANAINRAKILGNPLPES